MAWSQRTAAQRLCQWLQRESDAFTVRYAVSHKELDYPYYNYKVDGRANGGHPYPDDIMEWLEEHFEDGQLLQIKFKIDMELIGLMVNHGHQQNLPEADSIWWRDWVLGENFASMAGIWIR